MSSAARFAAALLRRSAPAPISLSGVGIRGSGGVVLYQDPVAVRPLSSAPSRSPGGGGGSGAGPGDDKSKYVLSQTDAPYARGKHRSNALELVERQPVIEVEGDMAVCAGGGGALGHPLEYIKVGSNGGQPVACIYCGLKFRQKGAH